MLRFVCKCVSCAAMDEPLPFSQLNENEFEDFVSSNSKLNLETCEISNLPPLIFNPFSTNNRVK